MLQKAIQREKRARGTIKLFLIWFENINHLDVGSSARMVLKETEPFVKLKTNREPILKRNEIGGKVQEC